MTVFLHSSTVEIGTWMHCSQDFLFLASKPAQTSTNPHAAPSEQVQKLQLPQAYLEEFQKSTQE